MKYIFCIAILCIPTGLFAQEVYQELKETVRAEVVTILQENYRDIIGTDTKALVQEVVVHIKEGEKKGDEVTFENDLLKLEKGDSIYVNRLVTIEGVEYYTFKDADRHFALVSLGALFVLVLTVFSGFHGLRALMSLALSILIIFFVLVPLLLNGYSPVFVSVLVSGPILASALFLTHGFRARTTIAFLGTFGAVMVTGSIAGIWVSLAQLTGLSSDEAIYLNFSTKGSLDFGGILLGSIIIGILGVLDDVSITQAAVVLELKRANKNLTFRELYRRALRVGSDHIGSLVNTLSLAYIGVALPLVLLLVKAESSLVLSLNQEIVAVELIRIFIGSIGLILAVPLTTAIASWWYERYPVSDTIHDDHTHASVSHTHT